MSSPKLLCEIGKIMYDKGLIAGVEGNLSFRESEHELSISSAGICKGRMLESDINRIDFDGKNIEGDNQPSSEYQLHIAGYLANSSYRAAVHAHSPYATSYALKSTSINAEQIPEFNNIFRRIPLVDYAEPGSNELADNAAKYLPDFHTILLERHGLISFAPDLWKAYYQLEMAEQCARILWLSDQL